MPIAAYRKNVRPFAPAKALERKSDSGTMGDLLRASTKTKAIAPAAPRPILASTLGRVHPALEEAIKPNTRTLKPTVARVAPVQSRFMCWRLRLSGMRQRLTA